MHKDMNTSQELYVPTNTLIWDCGSSLYDSFELKSFKLQLDSAITARSFSMPHITNEHQTLSIYEPADEQTKNKAKKNNFITKSLRKLFQSVSRLKSVVGPRRKGTSKLEDHTGVHGGGASSDVGFEGLSVIQESCEKELMSSPEFGRTVTKTQSERLGFRISIGALAVEYGAMEFR